MKIDSRTNFSGSGVISASPRNILADRDNRAAYPTIQLPGDQNRLGNKTPYFDDYAKTRIFQTGSRPLTLEYPSLIPIESPSGLRQSAVMTPNVSSSISISSGFGSSVYAEFDPYLAARDSSEDAYEPFKEFNKDAVDDLSVLEIPIKISSTRKLTTSITQSYSEYSGETSTGVFYYSPKSSTFENVGHRDPVNGTLIYTASTDAEGDWGQQTRKVGLFHGPAIDPFGQSTDVRYQFNNIGAPTSTFGGPNNKRLYATSSNLIPASDYINAPFLVSSIELKVSCSLNHIFDRQFSSGYTVDSYTFFLLRQSGPRSEFALAPLVSGSRRELITHASVVSWNGSFAANPIRNYPSAPIPATYYAGTFDPDYWFLSKENFAASIGYGVNASTFTGTASRAVEISALLRPKVTPTFFWKQTMNGFQPPDYWPGGSSMLGQALSSSFKYLPIGVSEEVPPVNISAIDRQIALTYIDYNSACLPATRHAFPYAPTPIESFRFWQTKGLYSNNAVANFLNTEYLLLPNDNLIFGVDCAHSAPSGRVATTNVYGGYTSKEAVTFTTGSWLELPPQSFSLVFKGRYLRDGEVYLPSSNQVVNTVAVHESLHSNNPVLDQYEIAPASEFSGSIRAQWITGSMTFPVTGWPRSGSSELIQGDNTLRKVFGSAIDGTSGDMASLQRNIRIVDASERYYDSFVPDPVEMWRATGYTPILVGSGTSQNLKDGVYLLKITPFSTNGSGGGSTYEIFFGNATGGTKYINDSWLHKYPFSSEFAGLQRRQRKLTYSIVYELDRVLVNQDIGFLTSSGYTDVLSYFSYPQRNSNVLSGIRRTSLDTSSTAYESIAGGLKELPAEVSNRILFGIGDGPYGIHLPAERTRFVATLANVTLPLVTLQKPVGFKYGLINANPMPTSAVFRATHYGHLRDMLEQRQYAAITLESIEEKSQIFPATNSKSARIKKATRPKTESPTKFPIEIKFRTPVHENPTLLGSSKDPMSTQSCNLSIYATSSLPYFDDEVVRNRTYPSGTI